MSCVQKPKKYMEHPEYLTDSHYFILLAAGWKLQPESKQMANETGTVVAKCLCAFLRKLTWKLRLYETEMGLGRD